MTERRSPPGAVEPFFFGDPALYGCLHEASEPDRGVVICHPFGHEYIAFHRAARQMATQISRAGLPVMRFDYSGAGDSAGSLAGARLDTWVGDVGRAIDELRERAGVERICLIGIRLGGTLATRAAVERDDIGALALWDPVIWGRSYLRALQRDTRRMLRVAHVLRGERRNDRTELLGFEIAAELEDDLRGLELDTESHPQGAPILLLETEGAASAPLGAALRASGASVETLTEALPHLWRWSEDITKVQLPHVQVRSIAGWVTEEPW